MADNITELGLLIEYEDILLGNSENFSNAYISKKTEKRYLKALFQYFYVYIMDWNAEQAFHHTEYELIKKMKLEQFLTEENFPWEINPKENLSYLATVAFPQYEQQTNGEIILGIYHDVLDGKRAKFPKQFFLDSTDGLIRLKLCFQDAMKRNEEINGIADPEKLYKYFVNEKKANKFLEKNLLLTAKRQRKFDTCLDMLYECSSLDSKNANKYIYENELFKKALIKAKNKFKKDESNKKKGTINET